MRINARLDEEHIDKLEILKNTEKLTTTEVIKRALDLYFARVKTKHKTDMNQLLESDFIGCGEGPLDLSENYKDYLTESLEQKHGID